MKNPTKELPRGRFDPRITPDVFGSLMFELTVARRLGEEAGGLVDRALQDNPDALLILAYLRGGAAPDDPELLQVGNDLKRRAQIWNAAVGP